MKNLNDSPIIRRKKGTSPEELSAQLADSVQQLNDNEVNMKSVGAKGDGVTDNTSIIQSQLNAISSQGGGTLYFPRGTYMFTVLTIPSNVKIRGAGAEVTTLKSLSLTTAMTISGTSGSTSRRVEFDSIMLYFPNIATNNSAIYGEMLYYFGFTNVRVYGNSATRLGIGLHIKGTSTGYYGTFFKTQFANFDTGVRLEDSANAHRFMASWFYGNNIGLEIKDSNGISVIGNTFQDFIERGIYFNDSGNGATNSNMVSGNYFEGIAGGSQLIAGIEITSTAKTTAIYGNHYSNLRSVGIPEVVDNGKSTLRLEYNSQAYAEVMKLPTFTILPTFDEATKPTAQDAYLGSMVYAKEVDGTRDKLRAILRETTGTRNWVNIIYEMNNQIIFDAKQLSSVGPLIQDSTAGYLRLGRKLPTSPSAGDMYWDNTAKTIKVYDGTVWKSATLA